MPQNKKRKKKGISGELQHQQMLKNQEKEFWQKIINITKTIGAYDAFKKIPEEDRRELERMKPSAFRVEEAEKGTLDKDELKEMKDYVSAHLKSATFEIEEGGPSISLYDHFSAGLALKHYIFTLSDYAYPEELNVKKAFASYMKAVNEDYVPQKQMLDFAKEISWRISTVNYGYYWFRYDVVCKEKSQGYNCFKVHKLDVESRHFILDGIKRPAFRVGFPIKSAKVLWAKPKAEDLGLNDSFNKPELDVYVQSHALMRLKERLEPITLPPLNLNLFFSVAVPKIASSHNGELMIEYIFRDLKLGYLKAIVHDGVLLIKTFLFITNDGTPEGKKLKELAGLNKVGKQYFQIDKLNTFINYDVRTNQKLKTLFIEAGCADLFDFEKHFTIKLEEKKAADAILKYLNVE